LALKLHRRCVSCQCVSLRDDFWRLVRVPIATMDNLDHESATKHFQIQLDHGMGRSAYLCQKLSCLQLAQKKNRLGRSLRAPIPPELFDVLKSRLDALGN
jgi:uncharacterized protein